MSQHFCADCVGRRWFRAHLDTLVHGQRVGLAQDIDYAGFIEISDEPDATDHAPPPEASRV